MPRMSSRLQILADQLLPERPVWDFCCDHGYLGIYAALSGKFPEIHFVDQVPEIIKKLETDFHQNRYPVRPEARYFFWPLPGEKVPQAVQGSVTIAGVGAYPLLEILEGLQAQNLLQASRLILSPHSSEDAFLRKMDPKTGQFLTEFKLTRHLQIQERKRARQIWVFDRISV